MPNANDKPLTIPQVASFFGVTRQCIYAWLKSGDLQSHEDTSKTQHRHSFTWDQLRAFDATRPESRRIFRDA